MVPVSPADKGHNGSFAAGVVHIQERLYHIIHQGSIQQSHHRMPGPKGVPSGEGGELAATCRDRRYAHVVTAVLSVHVARYIRDDLAMV